MKKLFITIILSSAALSMVACGDSGSSNSGSDASVMPEAGYYKETARYINDVEAQAGTYEPQYVWVDDATQMIHHKGYDDGQGVYHHKQEQFDDHIQVHAEHYSGGHHGGGNHGYTSGHGCYNVSYDSYETEEVDDNGDAVRMVFSRISQTEYDNIATQN